MIKILSYVCAGLCVLFFLAALVGIYYVVLTPGSPAYDDRFVSLNWLHFELAVVTGFAAAILRGER